MDRLRFRTAALTPFGRAKLVDQNHFSEGLQLSTAGHNRYATTLAVLAAVRLAECHNRVGIWGYKAHHGLLYSSKHISSARDKTQPTLTSF